MYILELRKIYFLKLKVQSSLNSQMETAEEWISEFEDCLKLSNVKDIRLSWALKSLQMVTAAMKLKDAYSLEEKLWQSLTAYYKSETLFRQQKSILSNLWFFL